MPPTKRTSRISCVAYATLDSASLAKIGSASRLASSECPTRSELTGLPMITRLSTRVNTATPRTIRGFAVLDARCGTAVVAAVSAVV